MWKLITSKKTLKPPTTTNEYSNTFTNKYTSLTYEDVQREYNFYTNVRTELSFTTNYRQLPIEFLYTKAAP